MDGGLIALLAIGSFYISARIGLQPHDSAGGVAIIFTPWTDAHDAMTRAVTAGARFVRYGGLPFIVVVVPDGPDYSSRIFDQGALLVVDPQTLAACSSIFSNTEQGHDQS